eukprot:15435958-Alexandrium_andersonii.AAC.1
MQELGAPQQVVAMGIHTGLAHNNTERTDRCHDMDNDRASNLGNINPRGTAKHNKQHPSPWHLRLGMGFSSKHWGDGNDEKSTTSARTHDATVATRMAGDWVAGSFLKHRQQLLLL